jgi:hypothetical protein
LPTATVQDRGLARREKSLEWRGRSGLSNIQRPKTLAQTQDEVRSYKR